MPRLSACGMEWKSRKAAAKTGGRRGFRHTRYTRKCWPREWSRDFLAGRPQPSLKRQLIGQPASQRPDGDTYLPLPLPELKFCPSFSQSAMRGSTEARRTWERGSTMSHAQEPRDLLSLASPSVDLQRPGSQIRLLHGVDHRFETLSHYVGSQRTHRHHR